MNPEVFLVVGLAAILIFQFSRIRRAQRQVRSVQATLEVGVEVLTAAGMVATVVAVDDATVTLSTEDGHRSRWVRGAVIRVLPDTDPASARFPQPDGTSTASPSTGSTSTGTASTGTTSTSTPSTPASDTSSGTVDDDGAARNQD